MFWPHSLCPIKVLAKVANLKYAPNCTPDTKLHRREKSSELLTQDKSFFLVGGGGSGLFFFMGTKVWVEKLSPKKDTVVISCCNKK